MKTTIAALLVLFSTMSNAGILGVLTRSETTTSVTGKLVWKCTYRVAGNNTTVVLRRMCPVSMQFE